MSGGYDMHGLVLYADGQTFAAVSRSKRKLRDWQHAHPVFNGTPATECDWRMRDTSGWCDGSHHAHERITEFPETATVLW